MLIQDRITALRGHEKARTSDAVQGRHQQHDEHEVCRQEGKDGGRDDRPHENREPAERQPFGPLRVGGGKKVDRTDYGGKSQSNKSQIVEKLTSLVGDAQRSVAGPPRVPASEEPRDQEQGRDHRRNPVAQRVEPGERHIVRPQHDRHDVITERSHNDRHGDRDHEHAVKAHDLVVGRWAHDVPTGVHQLRPHEHREQATDEQHEHECDQVLYADDFVVCVETEVSAPAVDVI